MKQIQKLYAALFLTALSVSSEGFVFAAEAAKPKPASAKATVKLHPLTPVPLQKVTVDDKFWTPKLVQWRKTTINDVFDKFERSGAFENFDRVARKEKGGHKGDPWYDGLVYETITGTSDFLANNPDPVLQARVEGFIARIAAAAAADPDGYVNTGAQLNNIGIKWMKPPAANDDRNDNFPHTIYNAGCLVEAGTHFYKATGNIELLKVATRVANYMSSIMGPAPKYNYVPGHAVSEQTFVELYRLYRDEPGLKAKVGLPVNEKDYLDLAEFWIEMRGHTDGRKGEGIYNQDDKSVFEQPTLVGHSVRAGLLATGIATAVVDNKDQRYLETSKRWWDNMVEGKMYITGGLGAIPSSEGFGPDYELPNVGYAETCAAVSGGLFSHKLNLATADARYVDVLEKELYNGALSGISLRGTEYFYTNYLSSGPDHRRWEWLPNTPCCPPMFLKLNGALPSYIYATDANSAYVNLYIGSKANLEVGKTPVTLTQSSNYPWDGTIKLTVSPQKATRFPLNLRIPGWAKGATVDINGKREKSLNLTNSYAKLDRSWKAGDVVTLNLPMPVVHAKADPRVAANVGRVALERGPLVYCFEDIDNAGSVDSLLVTGNATFKPESRPDLLGGVTVLTGTVQQLGVEGAKPVQATAIPFYANSNREPTKMEVWVADEKSKAVPMTLAREAKASASHCFQGDTVAALNDGLAPNASDDKSVRRMTWWDHKGTQEWAQLTFKAPRRLSSVDVYWWDESRIKEFCRVPQSWKVQYLDGGEWKDVTGASAYGTAMDKFNHVDFQGVETTALRIVAQLQPEWSGGILEWRVK
ncbi:glycoside hydrolase family 127 protein [bacterium]|nr:MAG: glycoside hydrolase family 127 protein [bacterium]